MAGNERAVREVCKSITYAQKKLAEARLDGACELIQSWLKRRDDLLEELSALLSKSEPSNR